MTIYKKTFDDRERATTINPAMRRQLSQMYLLNLLLEGQFSCYGLAVMGLTTETKPFERIDPMARLFPKLTKCTIHTFGPGGSSQTHDALCVLPLNVVNEKIFVLLWFWFIFLAGVGALALVYRYQKNS
jgi:hypothetical protein